MWLLFQSLIIFAVVASNIAWQWMPNPYVVGLMFSVASRIHGSEQPPLRSGYANSAALAVEVAYLVWNMMTRPVFFTGVMRRVRGGDWNVKTAIIAVSAAVFMAAAPAVFAQGVSSKTPVHEVRAKG
jgi:hypothetical protein